MKGRRAWDVELLGMVEWVWRHGMLVGTYAQACTMHQSEEGSHCNDEEGPTRSIEQDEEEDNEAQPLFAPSRDEVMRRCEETR